MLVNSVVRVILCILHFVRSFLCVIVWAVVVLGFAIYCVALV